MATLLTVSNLTKGGGGSGSSYVTNSISVSPGQLILIPVQSFLLGGVTPNIPSVTGLSLTWTQIDTRVSSSPGGRITIFRAMPTTAQSGTLTLDFGGQTQHDMNYIIDKIVNANQTGSNGANAIVKTANGNATSTTPSANLSSLLDANNASYGAVMVVAGGVSVNPGTNFTELAEENAIASTALQTEYGINQSNMQWTLTGSAEWVTIGMEIKQKISFTGGII